MPPSKRELWQVVCQTDGELMRKRNAPRTSELDRCWRRKNLASSGGVSGRRFEGRHVFIRRSVYQHRLFDPLQDFVGHAAH